MNVCMNVCVYVYSKCMFIFVYVSEFFWSHPSSFIRAFGAKYAQLWIATPCYGMLRQLYYAMLSYMLCCLLCARLYAAAYFAICYPIRFASSYGISCAVCYAACYQLFYLLCYFLCYAMLCHAMLCYAMICLLGCISIEEGLLASVVWVAWCA